MRNNDAEKQLREAWNNYETLLNMYKERGYQIKRNDKTGEHIVQKNNTNPFGTGNPFADIYGNMFGGIK